jgi:hypothetical protein
MFAASEARLRRCLIHVMWLSPALVCLAAGSHATAVEPAKPAKKTFFWIEGEDATARNVKAHPWWYDKVKRDQLSGGDWIHHFDEKVDGTADYDFEISVGGDYHFWLHANPVAAKLSYQLDKGSWVLIDKIDKKARDIVNIAADNKPDLRFIAWIEVGKLTLDKGTHRLRFKFHSNAQHHGGLDVIVLSMEPFTPHGIERPDGAGAAKLVRFDTGKTWAFNPAKDPFKDDALLDLRYLNEKEAGAKGFVKLSADGSGFVLGDGTPVRFWAVGDTVYTKSDAELAYHARFLAKLGVNMVRMHGSFAPKGAGKKITDYDEAEIDRAWRLVAAMKKQGIYTTISPYWASGGHTGTAASWGIDDYGDKADLWALLFFRDDLKEGYKAWTKALLTKRNPYTGLPLAKDPAVAIFQIQNEDSLFFWTLQGVKPAQLELLGKKFGQWLVKKYGSLDAAKAAWDNHRVAGDDFAAGKVGLMQTWHMTQPQQGGAAKRMRDQVRFLAETQRDFYAEISRYFREELGCQQLINASNWITADPEKLNDIERWTYTATDVLAVNKYYGGGPHNGPNAGWRIDPGDFFEGRSVLKNPTALPTDLKQVVGHPIAITESCWVYPLAYESEGPFLIAAYEGLTGAGPFYWFSADTPGYCVDPFFPYQTFPDGQRGVFKWSLHPGTQTQFPAAALMYRKGYIRRGPAVVHEERALHDLWDRKTPVIAEGRTFDPGRDTRFAEGAYGKTAINPLAFLVGPVEVKYGGDPAKTTSIELSKYIEPTKRTVSCVTGELKWNYGIGLCTLDTPIAQGATGFFADAGGVVKLSDAVIRSGNDYVTVTLVALDDKPLRASEKVLVQVGTVMRPTGWTTKEATFRGDDGKTTYHGEKIVNTGKPPWQVAISDVTVSLRTDRLTKAVALDANGYKSREIPSRSENGTIVVKLPADCLYAVLQR